MPLHTHFVHGCVYLVSAAAVVADVMQHVLLLISCHNLFCVIDLSVHFVGVVAFVTFVQLFFPVQFPLLIFLAINTPSFTQINVTCCCLLVVLFLIFVLLLPNHFPLGLVSFYSSSLLSTLHLIREWLVFAFFLTFIQLFPSQFPSRSCPRSADLSATVPCYWRCLTFSRSFPAISESP